MLIFLNIFIIFCMFVIGALFGSFFSLATYRIPRHQDIVATRSYCTTCKHRLGFFDLIPVLSYIIRGGKCKYCHEKISIRYFLLETCNGLVFVLFYLVFGYTLKCLIVALVYVIAFVLIGSYIMSKKMTSEERAEIEKNNSNKSTNKKLNKKAGIFVSEIIIAMILFTVLMASTFITSKNYNAKASQTIAQANANSIAVKNIEMCLATKYDKLESYTLQQTMGSTTYSVTTNITRIADQDTTKKDLVKKIEVKVSYMYNGKLYEKTLNTLKGKVL